MVLVADNAPYHHKRNIGALGNVPKKRLVGMMVSHGVEYIDLPYVTDQRYELAQSEDSSNNVQDRGDCVQVNFIKEEQLKKATANNPRVATLEELSISFVTYVKENKPELLDCEVETHLRERGHEVMWTPLYCPDLQPIKMFWTAGKNNVALNHNGKSGMKDVVKFLREGWYVNYDKYPEGHPMRREPADCQKLWKNCLLAAETKYVRMCEGIQGGMGELLVDDNAVDESIQVPIDTFVVNLTSLGDYGEMVEEAEI